MRWEGQEQRLIRKLAAGTDIDATSGTQYTEGIEPAKLSRTSARFTRNKYETFKQAKRHTDRLEELSLWADGSLLDTGRVQESVVVK